MARNQEKAQAMLNRWIRLRREMERGEKPVRPALASECTDHRKAEFWRLDVVRDIAAKVSDIQNASLGEFRIRELNDEINRLMKEKMHWERRIIELGGPDYITQAKMKKDPQLEGLEARGAKGYKYFGAARHLPGVRELFDKPVSGPHKRSRWDLIKNVTPDYYGYRDDDDGILEKREAKVERRVRQKIVADWKALQEQRRKAGEVAACDEPEDLITAEEQAGFAAFVSVPSQSQVAAELLAAKKRELMKRFQLENVQAHQEPTPPATVAAE